MADQAIGKGSLILNTESSGLNRGLKDAERAVEGFAISINKSLSIITKNPVVALIATGLQAAKGFWDTMSSDAFSFYDKVKSQAKSAFAVGLSTSSFQGLAAGTRVDPDTLTAGLAKMQRAIQELSQGGLQAQTTFGRVGLTINDLGGSAEEQFLMIADQISNMENSTQQMQAAFSVFGRGSALELLPSLKRGRAGIEELIAKRREQGLVFSNEENAQMVATSKVWKEIQNVVTGAWNRIYLAISPIWLAIGQAVQSIWEKAGPYVKAFSDVIMVSAKTVIAIFQEIWAEVEPIITGIFGGGLEMNSFDEIKANVLSMARTVVESMGAVLRTIAKIGSTFVEYVIPIVLDFAEIFITGMRTIAPAIVGIANTVIELANTAIGGAEKIIREVGGKIFEFISDIANSAANVASAIPGVGANIARALRAGASGADVMARSMRAITLNRIDPIDADAVDAGFQTIQDGLQTVRDMVPGIAEAMGDMFDPDAISAFFDRVEARVNAVGSAMDDSANSYNDDIEKAQDKLAGGFTFGSKEAANVVYQNQFGGGQDRALGFASSTANNTRATAQAMNELVDLVRNGHEIEYI